MRFVLGTGRSRTAIGIVANGIGLGGIGNGCRSVPGVIDTKNVAGALGVQEQIIGRVLAEGSREGHGHGTRRGRTRGDAGLTCLATNGIRTERTVRITGTTIRIGSTETAI